MPTKPQVPLGSFKATRAIWRMCNRNFGNTQMGEIKRIKVVELLWSAHILF